MAYTKCVQTGAILEIYTYEKEPSSMLRRGKRRTLHTLESLRPRDRVQKRRSDSSIRAQKSFRRLVAGNLSKGAPVLLTLTMLDIVGIRDAYRCYTAFGSRLRRFYGKHISWLSVPEFQERGAVHFHVLIWGLPYGISTTERNTRRIQNIWSYGTVDLVETNGAPQLATYLSKYMSKTMQDDRLVGQKAYSSTRNIVRPVSTNSSTQIDFLRDEFGINSGDNLPSYEFAYATLFLGRATYQRYDIKT